MTAKFKIGQKVKLSIPRDDLDYKFDGKIGIIENVIALSKDPEYSIKFMDGTNTGLHFLERDLMGYSGKDIKDQHINLKCPECGCMPLHIFVPDNDDKVKVVIFKCFFSATFNISDATEQMQQKLDEAKKTGKLKEFGI
mgnify:FL=1